MLRRCARALAIAAIAVGSLTAAVTVTAAAPAQSAAACHGSDCWSGYPL